MGRNTNANKTPLLTDAEQNIGNSSDVLPQNGTGGVIIPQTNPSRILNLGAGGSAVGQTTSVVVTATRLIGAANPYPGLPGPITGIVEFGNGGRFTRAEFDVPIGPYVGNIDQATDAISPQDGGVIISVPTGVLRVYARYDNLLIYPTLQTVPPQSLADIYGLPFLGPGGPSGNPVVPPEPVGVQAMAAYFNRAHAKVYKTNYLYVANISAPQTVTLAVRHYFCLPPFTKSFRVLRTPLTSGLSISLFDGVHTVDQVDVAGGVNCPKIDVVGHECIVGLQSPPNSPYTLLALCCEIGI